MRISLRTGLGLLALAAALVACGELTSEEAQEALDEAARWIDPCPQSGTYTLTTPSQKHLTLSFSRTDATTIRATIASGARSYDLNVHTL